MFYFVIKVQEKKIMFKLSTLELIKEEKIIIKKIIKRINKYGKLKQNDLRRKN